MIEVKKGEVYTAYMVRRGESSRGNWELINIDEKQRQANCSLFVENNPTTLAENQKFKVVDIVSVKMGHRKDNNGQWKPNTSVNVVIEPIASEFDAGDDGNPFMDTGEVPWDDDLPL